jgi:hypothetical protein
MLEDALQRGVGGMFQFPALQMSVAVKVKGCTGWFRGVVDLSDGIIRTTAMVIFPNQVAQIRHFPQRDWGGDDRAEPWDRDRGLSLGEIRDVAILLALIGGTRSVVVWQMAKASAAPEWRNGGTVALDREDRRRIALLDASELHATNTVNEEESLEDSFSSSEALAVGE